MKIRSFRGIFLLLLFGVFVQAQHSTVLELKETVEVIILPGEQDIYIFRVPNIATEEELYITAEPTIPDPLQLPYLAVSSDNYHQDCFKAHAQFSSICKIPHKELTKGRQFQFLISCSVQCHLVIKVYTSDVIILKLGQEISLSTFQQMDTVNTISLHIPENEKFSSLRVAALIDNFEQTISERKEGVTLFLNWGDQQTKIPTEQDFMGESQELFSGGRVVLLSSTQIKPGNWLKIYLKLSKGVKVRLSVIKNSQQWSYLQIGRSYFDTLTLHSVRTYRIQPNDLKGSIENKTIELVFDFYSGNPDITIGFDAQFSKKIEVSRNHPSISVQLTPQMRKQNGIGALLFVRMQTYDGGAEYQFYSQIVNNEIVLMKPNTAYFDELNNTQIYQYIFDERYTLNKVDEKNSFLYNYTFKIESSRGKGKFYIARCTDAELTGINTQNLQSCLLKRQSDLLEDNFAKRKIEISTVQAGSLSVVNVNYDVNECSLIERRDSQGKAGTEYRHCVFQIITVGQSQEPWVYQIYGERKYHINYLREGEIIKQYLVKDSYAFFAFAVPEGQNISEIVFFSTTFSGRSVLLVSSQDKFPTLSSKASDLLTDSGSTSSLTLKGAALKEDYYVSIYSQSFSEVNIGVVVHRASNNGIKELTLQEGNLLSYTLPVGQTEVHFKIHDKYASNLIVNLNQVVGLSEMKVIREDGTEVICSEGVRSRQTCTFKSETDDLLFKIVVTGTKEKAQQFTIVFMREGSCKHGILNSPLFVTLQGLDADCYLFTMSRARSLAFSSSLTPSQLAFKDIEGQIYFNNSDFKEVNLNEHHISTKEMMIMCPQLLTYDIQFIESCQIGINFISISKTVKNFYFSLDEEDEEMVLFDGIQKKLTHLHPRQDKRLLYYKVVDKKPIKIFISTPNLVSDFVILSSFVLKTDFLNSSQSRKDLYPKIPAEQTSNLYQAVLGSIGTTVISISSEEIGKFSQKQDYCYLLITVSVVPTQQQQKLPSGSQIATFTEITLEVVQTETTLDMGSTKTGFIAQDNVQTYLVSPQNALISLRNIDVSNENKEPCASLEGALANGTVVLGENVRGGGSLQVKREDRIQHIFVKGKSSQCSYQISYISLETFLNNVLLSQPYDLSLKAGDTARFIYYHANYVSFKIVKLIGAGRLAAYILPIKQGQMSMMRSLQLKLQDYPIIDTSNEEHIVKETDKSFCFECYYLVTFSTSTAFQGEVIFLRNKDSIPLTTNYMVKEWLLPNSEYSKQEYIYYSLTQFNLTFDVLSGEVKVTIRDTSGSQLFGETISSKKIFTVNASSSGEMEYFSTKNMYKISVQAEVETEFYIRIDKNRLTERIFEGLPATFQVTRIKPLSIEFINGQSLDEPLNLLIQGSSQPRKPFLLNFDIRGQDEKGQTIDNSTFLLEQTQISRTIVLTLLNFKGKYFLSINSGERANVTVTLLKQDLTHILPNNDNLFNKEGVFQMFTNDSNVLVEVFKCKGDFYLMASKDFRDTRTIENNSTGPLTLRRPNYGGHYVLSVEGVFGSYYMRILNKVEQTKIEYMISYTYYDSINPYDYVEALSYSLDYQAAGEDRVQILIDSPEVVKGYQSLLQIASIVHYVYISQSKGQLKRFSQCRIKGSVIERTFTHNSKLIIDKALIDEYSGFKQNATIYISVEASVLVAIIDSSEENKGMKHLTFLYDPLEISQNQQRKEFLYFFTDNLVVFLSWMFLPFALSGAIVFYLLKFCIRRLIMAKGNMVEEVEIVATSTPTIPTTSKLADGISYPDSATTKIKESI